MYIGAHLSSAGGLDKAVDRAEAVGAESLQVFTQSPRTWRPTNHDPASFVRFRERRAEVGLAGVLCHALYLCNFAAPDDDVYEKSVAALRNTMQVACAIGADGVVVHVGSHLGSGFEAGLERIVPAMEQVLDLSSGGSWLLVEDRSLVRNKAEDPVKSRLAVGGDHYPFSLGFVIIPHFPLLLKAKFRDVYAV